LRPSPAEGDIYEGVRVRYLERAFPRRFFGARLRRALTDALARADVCHIHGVWNAPEWWASHLARTAGVPYVISPRGMLQPQAIQIGRRRKAAAFALLERRNLNHASLLHATSDQEAGALRDLAFTPPITVIPNGVDLREAANAPGGFLARLGVSPNAFVVLFLGRMHRIKRLDLLVEAFVELRGAHPDAHLVLAGPDEQGLLADLQRRLSAHADSVHAIGTVQGGDKWALIKDADVMVQCSDSESFGQAVVEALASGVPVIATRTCPWSVLEARECGLWVEQSAPAIAAALRTLAEDPVRRARMGERASTFAREHYSWDAAAQLMAAEYTRVLRERPH
jgi:glycosyltransferase involved in cell wall biosynthesis